jgi:phospholipase D1/2
MSDRGERPSLLRRGRNCCAQSRAGRVALLVDAAAYFDAFRQAAERAEQSIVILAWDFDSRTPLAFEGGWPSLTVGKLLNSLADRRRSLRVDVLDWDYPIIFGHGREASLLYGLGWRPHRRVRLVYDAARAVSGSQHQKLVVIDDKMAFVGGLDLAARRWDTPEHRGRDPRRVSNGEPYPPFHDVMVAVDGEAAQDLGEVARERWRRATGERLPPAKAAGDPWPDDLAADLRDVDVGIACTAPATPDDEGAREVEQLYLDMIGAAERYVYVENQYFTARRLGDALAARLAEPHGPEIVLVTRLLSHGWLEEATMHTLRARLVRDLRAADRYGRFHALYPHVDGLAAGTCVDVHSKLMIADDEWLRIGSSNLNNRSMGLDTECDVLLEARGDAAHRAAVRRFLARLLGEHMGAAPEDVLRRLDHTGSLARAIAAFPSDGRSLRRLPDEAGLPDAILDTVAIADPERPVSLDALVSELAPETPVRAPGWWAARTVAIAAAVVALGLVWRVTPLAGIATAEHAVRWAEGLAGRPWVAPLVVFAYIPASIVLFPRLLITFFSVVAFGPWLALVFALTGNLSAAAFGYGLGRRLRRDTVRRLAGERLNRLCHAFAQRGLVAIAAVRMLPLGPFTVQNVVAGAIRVDSRDFFLGTAIGMLPGVLATTVLGHALHGLVSGAGDVDFALLAGLAVLLATAAVLVGRTLSGLRAPGPSRAATDAPTAPNGRPHRPQQT